MKLGKKQEEFARLLPYLLLHAHNLGFQVRIGHVYRCPDCKVGSATSKHKRKLAIDLNLFKGGKFLRGTEDHRELGEYWESIGGRWGGRFNDGNHYEL